MYVGLLYLSWQTALLSSTLCSHYHKCFTSCGRKSHHHDHICCCTDLLAKCKDVADPTLAAAVDKIKETVKACPCGLKYKQLADLVAEQTASRGSSETCTPEMQQIIKGAACMRRNDICARAYCQNTCSYLPTTHCDLFQHISPSFLYFPVCILRTHPNTHTHTQTMIFAFASWKCTAA